MLKKVFTLGLSMMLVVLCFASCSNNTNNNTTNLKSGSWTGTIGDKEVTLNGAYLIDGEEITLTDAEYASTTADETVFLVVNGGKLTIKNSKIEKTGGTIKNSNESKESEEDSNAKSSEKNSDSIKSEDNNKANDEEPPAKPEGDSEQTPPEKLDNNEDSHQPPEKPSNSDNNSTQSNNEPPAKPKGDSNSSNKPSSKSGGGNSSEDAYNFYGKNSAIVCIGKDSSVIIENCKVTTDAEGANAVFASDNSNITVNGITINTNQNSSRGLYATYGGTIIAKDVNIATKGAHCANLATDRGGGTVTVTGNNTFSTEGEGSPIIYSTGDISVNGGEGTSEISSTVVVEGLNKITLENCNFISNAESYGILLYQSTSGDAADEDSSNGENGYSELNAINSSITYNGEGEVIHITNTTTQVNFDDVTLTHDCEQFISAESDRWGKEGSNGGNLTMNVSNMTLNGKIYADDISNIEIILGKNIKNNTSTEGNVSIK